MAPSKQPPPSGVRAPMVRCVADILRLVGREPVLPDQHLHEGLVYAHLLFELALELAGFVELFPCKVAPLDSEFAEDRILLGGHVFPPPGRYVPVCQPRRSVGRRSGQWVC